MLNRAFLLRFAAIVLTLLTRDNRGGRHDHGQHTLIQFVPKQGAEIVLVLFLSFLIGLEREEEKATSEQYRFGGVRTFPLLGLLGYALSLFSEGNLLIPAVGFVVVGAFLWQSYRHKLEGVALAGMTTEISGLLTYVIGALVWRGQYWMAITVSVLAVALLELKTGLENLAKRMPGDEILTFAKFLLLTAVILPIVPNQMFGSFRFQSFQNVVGGCRGQRHLLRQLPPAVLDEGARRCATRFVAGRRLFLDAYDRGARQASARAVASASVLWLDTGCLRRDVLAPSRASGHFQSPAAAPAGIAVPVARGIRLFSIWPSRRRCLRASRRCKNIASFTP